MEACQRTAEDSLSSVLEIYCLYSRWANKSGSKQGM